MNASLLRDSASAVVVLLSSAFSVFFSMHVCVFNNSYFFVHLCRSHGCLLLLLMRRTLKRSYHMLQFCTCEVVHEYC